MNGAYAALRPLLFALDAERAHGLTLRLLDGAAALGLLPAPPPAAPVQAFGLSFPNPVGLAAGLDKDAAHVDALGALGFGFLEVGTVTPRPQQGNPRPRLFRIPAARAVVNRMGFNNRGVDALVGNLRRSRYRGIVGVNIGKNADTPLDAAAGDYLQCLEKVHAHAHYVTVNVSSPNTRGLRGLQQAGELAPLLGALVRRQAELERADGRHVPLWLKIAPDLEPEQLHAVAAVALAEGADALVACNTTLARAGVEGLPGAAEQGGLSGAPLRDRAQAVLATLATTLAGRLPLVGVGGILCGADARARRDAGATLVQLYTGLVYRGPGLVHECAAALAARS